MRRPSLVAVALLASAIAAAAARGPAPKSCADEVGPRAAGRVLRDCRLVAGAVACRAEQTCAALRAEIARACEAAAADALPLCETHVTVDDEAEDDE